jgi:uncharacterized protein (DUF362 family)
MAESIDRRTFLKRSTATIAAAGLAPALSSLTGSQNALAQAGTPDLVVVKGGEPGPLVRAAFEAYDGIGRVISKGDVVVLKPNISWDRMPEQAANTNPALVAELVTMCKEAGAKKVKVIDRPTASARRAYLRSGIQKAVKAVGGDIHFMRERDFVDHQFPEAEILKTWPVNKEIMEANKLINIPCAKHHSLSLVSLGIKNMMGVLGGDRGQIHIDLDVKLADMAMVIKPDLVVLDAYRVLLRNGPTGGSISDTELRKTVAIGADMVAVDSFGASMFNHAPEQVGFIKAAADRGLGESDLSKLNVKEVNLA